MAQMTKAIIVDSKVSKSQNKNMEKMCMYPSIFAIGCASTSQPPNFQNKEWTKVTARNEGGHIQLKLGYDEKDELSHIPSSKLCVFVNPWKQYDIANT